MDKKHLLVAFVALVGIVGAFVIGCSLAQVPTAQQTPLLTTAFSFLAILGAQIWAKADTDKKLNQIDAKADTAARKADIAAAALTPPDVPECDP